MLGLSLEGTNTQHNRRFTSPGPRRPQLFSSSDVEKWRRFFFVIACRQQRWKQSYGFRPTAVSVPVWRQNRACGQQVGQISKQLRLKLMCHKMRGGAAVVRRSVHFDCIRYFTQLFCRTFNPLCLVNQNYMYVCTFSVLMLYYFVSILTFFL